MDSHQPTADQIGGMEDPAPAERRILRDLIGYAPAAAEVYKTLKPDNFYYYAHQCIFEALKNLFDVGIEADEVTLPNELTRIGKLNDVGGTPYLIDLLLQPAVGAVDPIGIAHLVKTQAARREMMQLANDLYNAARTNNREASESVIRRATTLIAPVGSRTRWHIMPASDLKTLPPIQWLLPGLIPERGLTVLYGRSGEGKSFYALDLSLQVAQSRPVVYIAAEGQAGYAKRVSAWCIHNKQGEGQLHFCMGAVNLLDTKDVGAFIEALKQYKPAMLVVDTLARTMLGGDENSQRDMSLYIDACSQMIEQIGCAVLLVHHVGKSGASPRGSTVLPGASEQMIELTKEDDLIRVRLSKNKDEDGGDARYLRQVEIQTPFGTSVVLVPSDKVITGAGDRLSQAQRIVLETLRQPIFDEGAQCSDLESSTGLTRPTISSALNRLLGRNLVRRAERGMYALSPSGLSLLRENDPNDPNDPDDPNDPNDPNDPRPDQDGETVGSFGSLDQPELFPDGKRVFYP